MSRMPPDDNPLLNRPRPGDAAREAAPAPAGDYYVSPHPPAPPEPSAVPPAPPLPTTEMAPPESAGNAGHIPTGDGTAQGNPSSVSSVQAVGQSGAGRPAAIARPAARQPSGLTSVRDTVESIIIALVLAFAFRAFVVEAFVIPTGSMAPTLSGAHWQVICPKCGEEFDINASLHYTVVRRKISGQTVYQIVGQKREDLVNGNRVPVVFRNGQRRYVVCPNCGYHIPLTSLPGKPLVRTVVEGDPPRLGHAVFPWTRYGDRILVLKYLYYFMAPKRWDVVVFKEPIHAKQNFIKRLVGLPGETVEIVGGDVFINGKIARKPPAIERAMLQLVYNNDHYPIDAGKMRSDGSIWTNPWRPQKRLGAAGHWTIKSPVLLYRPSKGQRWGGIAFHHIRLKSDRHRFYLYNRLAYDDTYNDDSKKIVGDLDVRAVWTPARKGSAMRMTVGQRDNRFQVRWRRTGHVILSRYVPGLRRYVAVAGPRGDATAQLSAPVAGRRYRVEMSNVDREIRFWVNRSLVLTHRTPWTVRDAQIYLATGKSREMPRVALRVAGPCTISHLLLRRDIYYTQMRLENGNDDQMGTGTDGNPITLGPRQYFMLGDNSTYSADSRAWPHVAHVLADLHLHRGVVPQRFLVGKAFFVFWPAGFRISRGLPYPLVPNAGRMRFIR